MLEAMNRAARYFDADYADYDEDIPALAAFAQRTGGPLLELGCGTGRALIPLARRGYRVTGVDLSPEMLRVAGAKARAARVARRVTLIQGDYADAPLAGPYAFAFVLMNTFMHLTTQDDQLRALRHWREHLAPGGTLLVDVFHPDVHALADMVGRMVHDRTWTDPETGLTVMKWVTCSVSLAQQTLHVTLIYEEIGEDGSVRRTIVPYDARYLWRYEAELLLKMAGFELETIFGDWDLSPFVSDSDRMILVARCPE
jgi:SAM-dependent methyltransferase